MKGKMKGKMPPKKMEPPAEHQGARRMMEGGPMMPEMDAHHKARPAAKKRK